MTTKTGRAQREHEAQKVLTEIIALNSTISNLNLSDNVLKIESGEQRLMTNIIHTTVKLSRTAPMKGTALITGGYIENGFAYYTAIIKTANWILRESDIDLNWSDLYQAERIRFELFQEFWHGIKPGRKDR